MKDQFMLLNYSISQNKTGSQLSTRETNPMVNLKIKSSKAFSPADAALISDVIVKVQNIKSEVEELRKAKIKFADGVSLAQ